MMNLSDSDRRTVFAGVATSLLIALPRPDAPTDPVYFTSRPAAPSTSPVPTASRTLFRGLGASSSKNQ
jgi:hypothetical protein